MAFSGCGCARRGPCALPPDAVLVGNGDAVVEGVELDYGRNAGVSVDEYLIIQTGNAYKEVQNVENLFTNSNKSMHGSC